MTFPLETVATVVAVAVSHVRQSAIEPDQVDGVSVGISVEISPRACLPDCGGGATVPGGLPSTGLDISLGFVWIAVALLAFGLLLFLQRRRIRESAGSLQIPSTSTHTMSTGVTSSHARPSQPRRTQTGGLRETDDPDIE